jgi:uncharacterized protein with FMN-binding domain
MYTEKVRQANLSCVRTVFTPQNKKQKRISLVPHGAVAAQSTDVEGLEAASQ